MGVVKHADMLMPSGWLLQSVSLKRERKDTIQSSDSLGDTAPVCDGMGTRIYFRPICKSMTILPDRDAVYVQYSECHIRVCAVQRRRFLGKRPRIDTYQFTQ
jgi:hypothetical protein